MLRLAGGCVAAFMWLAVAQAEEFDLLIVGGRVMDGTGNPWFHADVGVREGRIVAVGTLRGGTAREIFDADGKWVVPGFIDLHSHADDGTPSEQRGLRSISVQRRAAPNVVAQGITTVVVNPDGNAPALSIAHQADRLTTLGIGPNAILMVGHNRIRQQVLGKSWRRVATQAEVARMRELLRSGLEAGAAGMTTGLEYDTAIFSDTAELLELARQLKAFDAAYIAHLRSQGAAPMWWLPSRDSAHPPTLVDAISETIRIGEESGATVVATHLKARGADYWGAARQVVSMMQQARARGVSIYGDIYPYDTSMSDGELHLVPDWALAADTPGEVDHAASLREMLKSPVRTAALRRDIVYTLSARGGAQNIRVMEAIDPRLVGRSIDDIARQRGIDPVSLAIALQLEGDTHRRGGVRLRSFSLAEQDIETYMREPWMAIATDGEISLSSDGPVHLRNYGTFPRAIAHYARDRGVVTVEHAIRAATGLPAQIIGLRDRGYIRAGQAADLVVLDPERLGETGTFAEPHRFPAGVDRVWIGGVGVVENGKPTGALAGKVLLREQARANSDLPDNVVREIRSIIDELMKAAAVPGMSVAVGLDDKVFWSAGFGKADLENDVPATAETRYRTASITKWMTATAAMHLVEQGKLSLDAPVQRYCAEFSPQRWPTLVRQLLNHTAGVRHYYGSNGEVADTEEQRRMLDELTARERSTQYTRYTDSITPVAAFANDPLLFEPGTRYLYTSHGYRLLGCALERAAGKPYRELIREAIFRPAAMTATVEDDAWEIVPHRTAGYSATPEGRLRRADFRDVSENLPAGGHLSTAADLVRFAMAFDTGRLVNAASRKRMLAPPDLPLTPEGEYYGFGVRVSTLKRVNLPALQMLSHTGKQNGTSTFLALFPERHLAVALMCNKDNVELRDAAVAVASALLAPARSP